MSMTNPYLSTIEGIKSEVLTTCDGPVGPFTVISRIMDLSVDQNISREKLANACYEALRELGCNFDDARIIPSSEY